MLKKRLVSFDRFCNFDATDVKMQGLFLRKNHILRCWVSISVLYSISTFTISPLVKLAPRKLEIWFILWRFFLPKFLLFICIFLSYRNWYATLSDTHAAFLEPLGHSRDIARSSLFDKYYFCRYLSKFNELVPLPNSRGLSTRYSVKLHGFFSQLLDIINMIILTVSFSVQLGSDILYL